MQASAPTNKAGNEQNKNLGKLGTENSVQQQLNTKAAGNQLSSMSTGKTEERKLNEKDIEFMMNEFMLERVKVVNILRRHNLETAVRMYLEE